MTEPTDTANPATTSAARPDSAATGSATPLARLAMVTLDCADPRPPAAFYEAVLGWPTTYVDENYGMLQGPGLNLGFGRVEDYQSLAWPNGNGSKQYHLDLAVDDIAAATEKCVALGATCPDDQPGETWTVLLDPAGHPFCLTDAKNWG